jgi:hypothetical protein
MRHLRLPSLVAIMLAAPVMALSPAVHAEAPAASAPWESRALAITIETLNPLGGVGSIYRRRYVTGTLVAAGSLLAGSLGLYAFHQGDRDTAIVSVFAYGALRAIGIAAVAQEPSPPPALPTASFGDPPRSVAKVLGFSYRFSF